MREIDFYWYIEGRLSEGRRQTIERHLLGCAGCRRELAIIIQNLSAYVAETDWLSASSSNCEIDTLLAEILVRRRSFPIQ
jgi:anti-sigma factor RsiW